MNEVFQLMDEMEVKIMTLRMVRSFRRSQLSPFTILNNKEVIFYSNYFIEN